MTFPAGSQQTHDLPMRGDDVSGGNTRLRDHEPTDARRARSASRSGWSGWSDGQHHGDLAGPPPRISLRPGRTWAIPRAPSSQIVRAPSSRKHGGQVPLAIKKANSPARRGHHHTTAPSGVQARNPDPGPGHKRSTSVGQISRWPGFPSHSTPSKAKRGARLRSLPTDGHLAADVSLSLSGVRSPRVHPALPRLATRASCARAAPGHTPVPEGRSAPPASLRGHRPPGPRTHHEALRSAHFEGTEGLTKRRVLDAARLDGGDRYNPRPRLPRPSLKEA